MFFNLGDKEILIIVGVFLFITVGISGLAALSMGRMRRWWRGDDDESPGDGDER